MSGTEFFRAAEAALMSIRWTALSPLITVPLSEAIVITLDTHANWVQEQSPAAFERINFPAQMLRN